MEENISSQLVCIEQQIASDVRHALYIPNIRPGHSEAFKDILELQIERSAFFENTELGEGTGDVDINETDVMHHGIPLHD